MNGANIVDLVFEPFALSFVEGLLRVLTQRNEAYESFSQPAGVKFRSALAMYDWGILV